jgi:rhodanese-related sulfurtransferase
MRSIRVALLMGAFFTAAVAGTALAAGDTSIFDSALIEPAESTPNISFDEMKKIVHDGAANIFDVRPYNEYAVGHIPGALVVGQKPGSTNEAYTSDFHEISDVVDNDKSAPMVLYCNGPFCGKSKRVAHDLAEAGFTGVLRFQLGMPVWRVLGDATEMTMAGIQYVAEKDQSAVFIDTRGPKAFAEGTVANAINIPGSEITEGKNSRVILDAKEDMVLPMEDHNTRIIVFGDNPKHVDLVADAVIHNAFSNVAYFPGTFRELTRSLELATRKSD